MAIPTNLAAAFDILNAGRASVGRKPFAWHDKLHRSAQELADWGWDNYVNHKDDVSADPHHDWFGRLERAGWEYTKPGPPPGMPGKGNASECGIGGDSSGRGEDGKDYPPDPSGWCHPYRRPETHAKGLVHILTVGITDPNEGHRWDFHAEWTHAALGYKEGIMVINYGYLPGEPTPEPQPTPTPAPDPGPVPSPDDLVKDDFDVIGN